jgi:hypothetical protein
MFFFLLIFIRFSSNDYQIIEESFNNGTYTELCMLVDVESGKGTLHITTERGFAVTAIVSDGQKSSMFTQFLSILERNSPNMILK